MKPVKLSASSTPRKLRDDAGAVPMRSTRHDARGVVGAAGGDAGADDVRVERARPARDRRRRAAARRSPPARARRGSGGSGRCRRPRQPAGSSGGSRLRTGAVPRCAARRGGASRRRPSPSPMDADSGQDVRSPSSGVRTRCLHCDSWRPIIRWRATLRKRWPEDSLVRPRFHLKCTGATSQQWTSRPTQIAGYPITSINQQAMRTGCQIGRTRLGGC